MKTLPAIFLHYMRNRATRRNLQALGQFLLVLLAMVTVYSVLFHYLMSWEGRDYSWITGVYWTLTVMSTLGFGDITFHEDAGRLFSIVVLLSGTLFLLILLPFTFIQFFYAPWIEAQAHARAPRELPEGTHGHVVLIRHGAVDAALIRMLRQFQYPYVILVGDLPEALRLHDLGLHVMLGEFDDPETYRKLRIQRAALVVANASDMVNTNVAFTVREVCETVPIVATASEQASVDILELAGASRVLQLAEMMGQSLARRVIGRNAKTRLIGQFDRLLIAEASASGTPLVGRTLGEIRLRDHAGINVVGVWERGRFQTAGPATAITSSTVLVLAGTREQLDEYDGLFCIYRESEEPVVILGGGRIGRATARALEEEAIDYRVLDKDPALVRDHQKYLLGDAADLNSLERAGIRQSPAVVITTHDDDMNIYLTLYCRRLRPDIQIISRANLERNVSTLHRAGADFVMSYASMGANTIFNLLQRSDVLLLAEGLDVFKVRMPASLLGKSLAGSAIREQTGCTIVAIETDQGLQVNPEPETPFRPGMELILIGSAEAEASFLKRYA